MQDPPIYPKFYFCMGKVSDKVWIFSRMNDIPQDRRQEVATEYENLYLAERSPWVARKKANTFLNGVAHEYRVNKLNL